MTRGRRQRSTDGPERRCIASGQVGDPAGMIRFVIAPDGTVTPDIDRKLPGRGIWVRADAAALDRAVAKKLFARAARAPVTVPPGLAGLVRQLLARRVVDMLSLARKGGLAVAGFEKVRDLALREDMAVLLQAADGSERGKSKLRPPGGDGTFIGCLTARELGLAFGREHVIHAALRAGGLTRRVVEDASRLAGLRGQGGERVAGEEKTDA